MSNQTLHIFKKDVRYLWREIVLSFALLVAYAWHAVSRPQGFNPFDAGSSFLFSLLPTFLVLLWALLILRAIHAESLVGDRQFWVTRPYEWPKLLAAKLLFVLAFINLPLFILQAFLLAMAGFPPASHLPGLLLIQLLWLLILIFPVAALAAVTASLGQFILAVLGFLVYLTAAGWALSTLVPAAGVDIGDSIPSALQALLVLGAGVTVVLGQFARRRTTQSRILILGAAAIFPAIALVAPYRLLIERAYPQPTAGQSLPVRLAFDPANLASRKGGYPEEGKVHIRIPLLVSGITEGSAVFIKGTAVEIEAPGGLQWDSGWHGAWEQFLPNRPHGQEDITLDKDFFERVKSSPARMRITYALAPLRARETLRIVVQGGFSLPGEGRCSFSRFDSEGIQCLFPMRAPQMLVSARAEEMTCPPGPKDTPLPAGTIGYGWIWSLGGSGGAFGINPVQSQNLFIGDWGEVTPRDSRPRLCPGTPLTVATHWEVLPRVRSVVEIDGIRLAEYQLDDGAGGNGGISFSLP